MAIKRGLVCYGGGFVGNQDAEHEDVEQDITTILAELTARILAIEKALDINVGDLVKPDRMDDHGVNCNVTTRRRGKVRKPKVRIIETGSYKGRPVGYRTSR